MFLQYYPESPKSPAFSITTHQPIQHVNHNIELATRVSGKHSCITAGGYGGGVDSESRHHLHGEYDLVYRTGAVVEGLCSVQWRGQGFQELTFRAQDARGQEGPY